MPPGLPPGPRPRSSSTWLALMVLVTARSGRKEPQQAAEPHRP